MNNIILLGHKTSVIPMIQDTSPSYIITVSILNSMLKLQLSLQNQSYNIDK